MALTWWVKLFFIIHTSGENEFHKIENITVCISAVGVMLNENIQEDMRPEPFFTSLFKNRFCVYCICGRVNKIWVFFLCMYVSYVDIIMISMVCIQEF